MSCFIFNCGMNMKFFIQLASHRFLKSDSSSANVSKSSNLYYDLRMYFYFVLIAKYI